MMLLAAEDLAIGYGTRRVAEGITLDLSDGEVLCLLGPNGAGKTTLFKTLLGLLPPIGGQVLLQGQDMSGLSRRDIAKIIAYVPQAQVIDFAYSVFDLVLMGRTVHLGPYASPSGADREHAYAALEALGIADLAGADTTRISGGQRQLVSIARALAQDARVIVLDEPTASLDLGNRILVIDTIRELAQRGLGIVLSTHDPDQALDIAQKVAMIASGTQLTCGPVDVVMTPENLSRAYGLSVAFERTSGGRKIIAATRS
jgi:iron complex transport system ATP-binding protein